ncbi:MAG TPA: hypothetical protein VF875_08935 [Anaeromyxobacter sp.]
MTLPIARGEKYALIALDAGTELRDALDLGDGCVALPRGAFEFPPHWKEWLGTIKTEAVERASLKLIAKAPSARPGVLDAENQELQRRVSNLFWGLLAAGKVRVEGAGTLLTGSHGEDGLDVRQVGDMDGVIRVYGVLDDRVTEAHLRRAALLGKGLSRLFADARMRRMRMAVNTFLRAASVPQLGDRIHQYVRVVDGLTRVTRRGRDRFKERCRTFVTPGGLDGCYEMYVIRSNVEHFQDPSQDLPPLDRREDLLRGYRRAHEAEALARHCMSHLLENEALWGYFADDHVDAFWAKSEVERAAIWGAPFDFAAALADFRPDHIPEE